MRKDLGNFFEMWGVTAVIISLVALPITFGYLAIGWWGLGLGTMVSICNVVAFAYTMENL